MLRPFHIVVWMSYTFVLTSPVIKGQILAKKTLKLLDLLFPAYWEVAKV